MVPAFGTVWILFTLLYCNRAFSIPQVAINNIQSEPCSRGIYCIIYSVTQHVWRRLGRQQWHNESCVLLVSIWGRLRLYGAPYIHTQQVWSEWKTVHSRLHTDIFKRCLIHADSLHAILMCTEYNSPTHADTHLHMLFAWQYISFIGRALQFHTLAE